MAIDFASGVFACPSGTGVTQVVSGLSFQPQFYYLWGVEVANESVNAHANAFKGMTDGTNEYSFAVTDENGTSDTQRDLAEGSVLVIINETFTRVVVGTHSAFDSDGFSINFSTTLVNTAVHWLAIGGLNNVVVGEVGAGNSPVTGLGFTPDFLMAFNAGLSLGGSPSIHSIHSGIGVADRRGGTTHQWWLATYNSDSNTDNKDSLVYTDAFTGQQYNGSRTWQLSLDSFESGGFTWSSSNADGYYYAAFNAGGAMEVYSFTKSTGAAPAAQDLPAATFTPGAYLLASGSNVGETINSPNGSSESIGVWDGTLEHHTFRTAPNNSNNSDMRQDNDNLLMIGKSADAVPDATAAASAITDSSPTITWDPNDSNAVVIGVWYFDVTSSGQSETTSGILNGGGSFAPTIETVRFSAPVMNGGGSFAPTFTRSRATTIVELKFDPGAPPYTPDRLQLWLRYRVSSANIDDADISVDLYQGTTLIQEFTDLGTHPTSFGTSGFTVFTFEETQITDWTDLRIRISATTDGEVGEIEIADVWLTLPEADPQVEVGVTFNGGGSIAATTEALEFHTTSGALNGGGSFFVTWISNTPFAVELNGGGSFTSTVASVRTNTEELNGGGSFSASVTATEAHTTSAVMNGGGSFSTTQAHAVDISVTVNGGGSFAVTWVSNTPFAVELNGGGSIAASVTASEAHSTSGILNGGGSIAAVTSKAVDTSGVLNGGGSFAVTWISITPFAVELNGGGSISEVVVTAREQTPTLNGGGSISATASGNEGHSVSGTMNGGGSIAATVVPVHEAADTVNGGGSFAVTWVSNTPFAVEVNGGGSFSATTDALEFHTTSAVLNGGGSITAAFLPSLEVQVELNGGGSLSAAVTASEQHTTSGVLNGGGSITPAVSGVRPSTGILNGGGSFSVSVDFFHATAVVVNGGGSFAITHTTHRTVRAFPDLGEGLIGPAQNGGGSISATASADEQHTTSGVLNGGGSLTVSVDFLHVTAVIVNGGGSIVVTWVSNTPFAVEFNGGGSLAATIEPTHLISVTVNGGGSFTTTVDFLHQTAVTLNGGGSLSPSVIGDHAITVELNGGGSINAATGSGLITTGIINGGGSFDTTHTTARTVRAFPDLGEGLLGPAQNGGGSITASVQLTRQATGVMNGGGSISTVVIANRSTIAEMNGGGRFIASTATFVINVEINGGGSFTVSIEITFTVTATMRGGGSFFVFAGKPFTNKPGGRAKPAAASRGGRVVASGQSGAAKPRRTAGSVKHGNTAGTAKP